MDQTLRDLWWVPMLRGIAAIAFGVLVLVWPGATVGIVAILFASLILVFGLSDIIVGIQNIGKSWGGILKLLFGLLEIGIVIYLFKNAGSGLTLALMGLLMSVVLVVMSIVMIGSAFINDSSAAFRWVVAITGIITLFIGITVARAPVVTIATLIWVLGLFGLITGPFEIASGLMLRKNK